MAVAEASPFLTIEQKMKFFKGQQVRQRGKHQLMEVMGEAGLVATQYSDVERRGMVVCAWPASGGRRIQRTIAATDLELVSPTKDGEGSLQAVGAHREDPEA